MKNSIEIDLSLGTTTTKCDNCSKELGKSYAYKNGSMTMRLKDGQHEDGYPIENEYHTCGEDCSREFLNKRAEKTK